MTFKYPKARMFLEDLAAAHSAVEVQDLLTVGMNFPDLGMVKIEPEHPVLALIG